MIIETLLATAWFRSNRKRKTEVADLTNRETNLVALINDRICNDANRIVPIVYDRPIGPRKPVRPNNHSSELSVFFLFVAIGLVLITLIAMVTQ